MAAKIDDVLGCQTADDGTMVLELATDQGPLTLSLDASIGAKVIEAVERHRADLEKRMEPEGAGLSAGLFYNCTRFSVTVDALQTAILLDFAPGQNGRYRIQLQIQGAGAFHQALGQKLQSSHQPDPTQTRNTTRQ